MTDLALRPARVALPLLVELLERQRRLALYGLTLLVLASIALAFEAFDPRTLANGIGVWVKPAKFFASVGVFSLTLGWFFGYVRPERRRAWLPRLAVGLVLVAGSFELVWIAWQGANGLESHFNFDTVFYRRMFNLMGVFAMLLVGATLPLAWEIARRPMPGLSSDFVTAVVLGLALTFLLGGSLGGAIAANGGHSVGPEAGGFPIFGWNRAGGDLRIAHFLGIHAMQAIPIMAALAVGLAARLRWLAVVGGTLLYVALTFALYAQAAVGGALWPL